jgi:type IV pilus assembly protein PilE
MTGRCAVKQGRSAWHGRGFSIVELLVTLVILGILTAIAVPMYSSYLVRGQRAAAKTVLLQTAQAMERFYTACGNYDNGASSGNGPCGTANYPLGASYVAGTCNAVAPPSPAATTYCVQGAASNANTYQLTATPCGDSGANCGPAGNASFTDPQCDVLTIDNTGKRGVAGTTPQAMAGTCWQQ